MALLLLSVVVVAFVLFFYGIGLWFLALIPLLFIGIFFWYYGATQTIKVQSSDLLKRYSLYVAWIIILAGIFGVANYFWMDPIYTVLWLLTLNLVLWMTSILTDYKDGTILFQLWFYLAIAVLLLIAFAIGGWSVFFDVFSLCWMMHLGIIAFMIFIIGHHKGVEKYLRYKLGILSLGAIFLVVFDQIKNIYLALTINGVLLTTVFYFISKIFKLTPQSDETKKNISVRRILAGERITEVKKHFRSAWVGHVYHFIENMPKATKQILEVFNIILIATLIIYYITHVWDFASVNHVLYRAVIATFVTNVLLLKKVWYNSIIQNLVVFLVINFAIYVSLFSYFQGDVGSVASRWIFRNVFSAAMIFYAHKIPMLAKIFNKTDYWYWIVSCVAAMVVNVILLIKTQLPGELIFFLVLVYLGLQSMIVFYAAKYLGKIQTLN